MTNPISRRRSLWLALAMLPLFTDRSGATQGDVARNAGAETLLVTPDWLVHRLNEPGLVILEASDGADYDRGHIKGARPVDIMAFHAHGATLPAPASLASGFAALGVSDSSHIVLYGDNMSTSMIYLALDYLGYGSRTVVLDGGKAAWTGAGQPLTTAAENYSAGHLTTHPRPEIVVNAGWLVSHLGDSSLTLVDARTSTEYAGQPDHMSGDRPGHIPGAHNLDWEDTIDSTGHLRPANELRSLFQSAGYAPGHQLVVYCTVGMRASHLYFVARSLGYHPRIYVGSMNDWASDSARPVARSSRP